jgi:hypothetical protein
MRGRSVQPAPSPLKHISILPGPRSRLTPLASVSGRRTRPLGGPGCLPTSGASRRDRESESGLCYEIDVVGYADHPRSLRAAHPLRIWPYPADPHIPPHPGRVGRVEPADADSEPVGRWPLTPGRVTNSEAMSFGVRSNCAIPQFSRLWRPTTSNAGASPSTQSWWASNRSGGCYPDKDPPPELSMRPSGATARWGGIKW